MERELIDEIYKKSLLVQNLIGDETDPKIFEQVDENVCEMMNGVDVSIQDLYDISIKGKIDILFEHPEYSQGLTILDMSTNKDNAKKLLNYAIKLHGLDYEFDCELPFFQIYVNHAELCDNIELAFDMCHSKCIKHYLSSPIQGRMYPYLPASITSIVIENTNYVILQYIFDNVREPCIDDQYLLKVGFKTKNETDFVKCLTIIAGKPTLRTHEYRSFETYVILERFIAGFHLMVTRKLYALINFLYEHLHNKDFI